MKDILKQIGIQSPEIEDTFGNHDIIIPGWNPFYAINWLAARAEKSNQKSTTFFFFENAEGYKFLSLETMLKKYQSEEFAYFPQNIPEDFEIPKEEIITYDFYNYLDSMKAINHGMFASKLVTLDLVRLKADKTEFDYKDDFKKSEHVDGKSGFDFVPPKSNANEKTDSLIRYSFTKKTHDTYEPIKNRQPNIKPNRVETWLLPRISKMEQLRYYRIRLVVSGNLNIKAGDTVTFDLPLVVQGEDNGKIINEYYKGKHLVTSIHHKINADGYIMILELIKDDITKSYE